jgi:hypothetical protein
LPVAVVAIGRWRLRPELIIDAAAVGVGIAIERLAALSGTYEFCPLNAL